MCVCVCVFFLLLCFVLCGEGGWLVDWLVGCYFSGGSGGGGEG